MAAPHRGARRPPPRAAMTQPTDGGGLARGVGAAGPVRRRPRASSRADPSNSPDRVAGEVAAASSSSGDRACSTSRDGGEETQATNVRRLFPGVRLRHLLSVPHIATGWLAMQDGKVSELEHVFIKGTWFRFMILPATLKNTPMFKRLGIMVKCWQIRKQSKAPQAAGAIHTDFEKWLHM